MKYEKFKQYILKHGTRTTKDSWLLKDEDSVTEYADAVEIDLSTFKRGYRTMSVYVHENGDVVVIKQRLRNDSYRYNIEKDYIEKHDDFQRLPWDNPVPWSEIPVDEDGNLKLGDKVDIIRNDHKEIEKVRTDYIRTHKTELKETYRQFKEELEDSIEENNITIEMCKRIIEEAKASLKRLDAARIRLSIPEFLENPQPGDRFMTRDKQVAIFANKVTQSNGEERLHWKVERPREGCAEDYGFSTLVNGRFCKKHKETLDIIKKLDK